MRRVKKVIIGIISLIIAPILVIMLLLYQPSAVKMTTVTFLTQNGEVTVNTEVADTFVKHQVGLMNRTNMDYNSGMLFIFQGESPRSFWMKNTLIPLDMIFVDSNLRVVSIIKNAQPCGTIACETYPSGASAMYVVEVNGGFADEESIRIGDKMTINTPG
ncbi:MAG: DUF192 domain-containing protein [Candidatus Aenigmatarchaeota archaeon]